MIEDGTKASSYLPCSSSSQTFGEPLVFADYEILLVVAAAVVEAAREEDRVRLGAIVVSWDVEFE